MFRRLVDWTSNIFLSIFIAMNDTYEDRCTHQMAVFSS